MHISSLPGEFGIGTLGRGAEEFVNFLAEGGFGAWQVLPCGPCDEYKVKHHYRDVKEQGTYRRTKRRDIRHSDKNISADSLYRGSHSECDYRKHYVHRTGARRTK